jgi:hypothetical protein
LTSTDCISNHLCKSGKGIQDTIDTNEIPEKRMCHNLNRSVKKMGEKQESRHSITDQVSHKKR